MKDVLDRQRTLDLPALSALIDGSVLAIRVANYADAQVCVEMTRRMLASPLYGKYENAPKIGRIGKALFETIDSVNAALGYLAGAPGWMEEMRMECAPYLSPIDRLRLEADILWPGGARVARLQGRPMFAGLLRVFEEGSEAEPHQDHLDWDVGPLGMHEGAYLETQLAANVYLEVPPSGGELVIWPSGLSREAYERYPVFLNSPPAPTPSA